MTDLIVKLFGWRIADLYLKKKKWREKKGQGEENEGYRDNTSTRSSYRHEQINNLKLSQ